MATELGHGVMDSRIWKFSRISASLPDLDNVVSDKYEE